MVDNNAGIQGLSTEQVLAAREKYGLNTLDYKKENGFTDAVKSLVKEPMILLLLAASALYFIIGHTGDAVFMLSAIILVAAISLYQDSRSRNALQKLKDLTQPTCKVVRDGKTQEIKSSELVMGDSLIIEEGTSIAADGVIAQSNDFSVNEAIITGESFPVFKDITQGNNTVYQGTTVASGLAIITITATGNETKLGKIGKSLESITEEQTPLEKQVNNFVKKMVIAGAAVFIVVWGINYFHSRSILDSLLKALTLAMSILPEEIPVALTTFMALGAWRLMKLGVVVKQIKTVETLGSATVICTDKTGTITQNKMALAKLFTLDNNTIIDADGMLTDAEKELVTLAMWASEPIPFDPMEVALHDAYLNVAATDKRQQYKIVHEYPLSGKPPMMTHLFENDSGHRIIAAKGAPEAIISVCNLTAEERQQTEQAINAMAVNGYRVLGVGAASFEGYNFPQQQQHFAFTFKGIVAFYDPPKDNISEVFSQFHAAGITVKIITGDNAATTLAIAKKVGFRGADKTMQGDELMLLGEQQLVGAVSGTNIFTRMFPEAKLRIINALKANNEIVAMTGDGVNDGPALKAAHIGIAMGKKGTEIAKEAASLILLEDDLQKMIDAVAMGRRIYSNLKKAIRYIISIHIPIILTVFMPLALGWVYPNIFSPVHIIFLELVMGPTCSIIYENEPMEKNIMRQGSRPYSASFFNGRELFTSIIQGLAITAATLLMYRYALSLNNGEAYCRTMVFTTLVLANVFLTLVNRSFYYSILTTVLYRNRLVPLIIAVTIALTAALIYIKPLAAFFGFSPLNLAHLSICIGAGFVSAVWFELVKWFKRSR